MEIRESSEEYLERILMIQKEKGTVHSIDIANGLGFSKASVSIAMKKLRENGYISMSRDGTITLEPKGLEIAEKMLEREELLIRILESIGVTHETAVKDACLIEHDLSKETFDCLKDFYNRNAAK